MSIRHATAAALVGLSLATPSDLSAAAPFSCVWLRTGAPAASMSGSAGATAVERANGSAVSTIRRFVSCRPPAIPFRWRDQARDKFDKAARLHRVVPARQLPSAVADL